MGDFKFEGDVNDLSAVQLKFVSDILKGRGFSNEKVIIEPVGKSEDNYVANVKRLTVEKGAETFKMIAKVAPTNPMIRATMPTALLFQNEHVMYTKVLPKFSELEKAADLTANERLKFAICYGTFMEEPNEIILLEDLKVSEFVILNKQISLTNETVKLVLQNFAKLHSLSYALKKQEPETYESFKNQLVNTWSVMNNNEEIKAYFSLIEDGVVELLDNNKYKNLAKGSIVRLSTIVNKTMKYDFKSKYSIIQQGDSWTNNIMFRMDNDKAIDCCMIDYQLSNHNSPVADIHYMIFNCTDYETRFMYYHDWIDYYHAELDKCLSNFGLKASMVFPRDQLDADLRRLGKIAFGLSIMLASTLMRESQEAADLKAAMQADNADMDEVMNMSKLTLMGTTSKIRFKDRVEGLIESFLELGYI